MRHVPHVLITAPWTGDRLELETDTVQHLTRVLRRADGSDVSYTDGAGRTGFGVFDAGEVVRGDERSGAEPPRILTLAVAPPRSLDRSRFVVEKAAELGARTLVWLRTMYTQGRPPSAAKTASWARAALEQSHGAWLMTIDSTDDLASLPAPVLVGDRFGRPWAAVESTLGDSVTIVVGPEGGFAPDEIRPDLVRVAFSAQTLRTETASMVGAALALLPGASTPGPATE